MKFCPVVKTELPDGQNNFYCPDCGASRTTKAKAWVNKCGVQPGDAVKPEISLEQNQSGVSVYHWRKTTCQQCKNWMPQDGCWWCTPCTKNIVHMERMWKYPQGKCTTALRFGAEDLWDNVPLLMPFYHVACMNNWKEVFKEQADLFEAVGLRPSAFVLGSAADARHVEKRMRVIGRDRRIKQYETPTLQALWQWCQANPTGYVLYAHTKGVSRPDDNRRVAWRRLMNEYVIRDWRANLEKLKTVDTVGLNWLDRANAHFSGNFFMARADWINRLPSPMDHRFKERPVGDNGSWNRLGCELWLGCRPGIRVESLCVRNTFIWGGNRAFRLLAERMKHSPQAAPYDMTPTLPAPAVQFVQRPAVARRLRNPSSALARMV